MKRDGRDGAQEEPTACQAPCSKITKCRTWWSSSGRSTPYLILFRWFIIRRSRSWAAPRLRGGRWLITGRLRSHLDLDHSETLREGVCPAWCCILDSLLFNTGSEAGPAGPAHHAHSSGPSHGKLVKARAPKRCEISLFGGFNILRKSCNLAESSVMVKIYMFYCFRKWAGPNGSLAPPKLQPWGPLSRTDENWWTDVWHPDLQKVSWHHRLNSTGSRPFWIKQPFLAIYTLCTLTNSS